MNPRPVIYVSAVGEELKSARDAVVQTLTILDCKPQWQEIATGEMRDLCPVLRERLKQADAVVQLIGRCYGPAPLRVENEFGECSYAQLEALYAQKMGKKVWRIIIDKEHPIDARYPDLNEQVSLQEAYRERVLTSGAHVRHSANLEETVQIVRDIRPQFPEGRRVRRTNPLWVPFVLGVAVVVLSQAANHFASGDLIRFAPESWRLAKAMHQLPASMLNMPGTGNKGDQPYWFEYKMDWLERWLGFPKDTLDSKLVTIAATRLKENDLSRLQRAEALFCSHQYAEAEGMALSAARETEGDKAKQTAVAIPALELAGTSAWADKSYDRALDHYRVASSLGDRNRDPLEWARLQWRMAFILDIQGQYQAAADAYREVSPILEQKLGPRNPNTLMCLNNLANSLQEAGKMSEALVLHRRVLAMRGNTAEALTSRGNVAYSLSAEGRYLDAEKEIRSVIAGRVRSLGPEHEETLHARVDLGNVLLDQGRHVEAEAAFLSVLEIERRTLGPSHLLTVSTRNNLANVWAGQKRYADAEREYRVVIGDYERIFGSAHPETLMVRNSLALVMWYQYRLSEAEQEFRLVLEAREAVLGAEHPSYFETSYDLALCLEAEGKLKEALELARRAEAGWKKVLSPGHPEVEYARSACERLKTALASRR